MILIWITNKIEEAMDNYEGRQVTIVDIKMPFWSMVIFMVKATIAAIPAFIILAIIWAGILLVIAGIIVGLGMYPYT